MPTWNWTYPLIVATALAAGLLVNHFTQSPLPLSRRQKLGLSLGAFCGSMLAAKLPYLFLDWERFRSGAAWFDNGKTITVGLIGGYFGVEYAKHLMGIPYKTGDGFAVPVAVSLGIGRLACFSAGCCFGTPTELPWGMRFHDELLRHPTQLYEVLFHFTLAAGMWQMRSQQMLVGNLIKFYLVSYYAYRFLTEFLRPEPIVLFGLTFYQLVSLFGILLFGTLWYRDHKQIAALLAHEKLAAQD